jgi:HlyD family secretion protein
MKKRIIILVLVLAVAAGAYVAVRSFRAEDTNRIVLSGNIEMNEVDIAFKTSGKLIERRVGEGDRVKAGDVVARLDQETLLRQKQREEAALALAEAQLTQAQTAVRWQGEVLSADVAQRQAELSSTQSRLLELKNGARPEEVREVRAAVEAAEAEFNRANRDWQRAQKLHKDDDISTAQFDQYRSRVETAEAALKQAKERRALVEAGPRSEVVEAASAQVARARAGVRVGEANRLELQRREQEITARRAEIERAKAQIAVIDSQLADTIAVSPVAGTVLNKSADVGEVVAPGTTIVTVGDIARPWLRGYIGERDLGRVKLGTKVRIRTDSYPGKDYWGRVTFISSEAEFTPKQIQTQDERVKLVYRLKIEVENPNHELKSNMPVDAEIVLEQ